MVLYVNKTQCPQPCFQITLTLWNKNADKIVQKLGEEEKN